MPNTTTATWTVFAAGKKARASEVNGNLDYAETNLWPHSTGTKVTNAYYLGDTDAAWKGVYTYSLDPLGATGVAIGTTTVANASDVAFEVAGAKAFLMPRLTTTQRDALTGVNGMMIYNSTLEKLNIYENGVWANMGQTFSFAETQTVYTSTPTTISSHSGSGRLLHIIGLGGGGGGINTFSITLDSVGYTAARSVPDTASVNVILDNNPRTTTVLDLAFATSGAYGTTTSLPILNMSFQTSMEIKASGPAASNTCIAIFEHS